MYDGQNWKFNEYMWIYDGYIGAYVDVLCIYGGICGCLMGIWG